MKSILFSVPKVVVPVVGTDFLFPVRRVYCVGRNYADHAKEMGGTTSKTNPFFFSKPTDAIVCTESNHTSIMEVNSTYPPYTKNYQHEVELVIAIGGTDRYSGISPSEARKIIYGYAIGIDMTRRDMQATARDKGLPWDLAKGADESAPLSAIVPVEDIQKQSPSLFVMDDGDESAQSSILRKGRIALTVNGESRQEGDLSSLITPIDELLSILSFSVALAPGDLLFTGTPAGVSAVKAGDTIKGTIEGVGEIIVHVK